MRWPLAGRVRLRRASFLVQSLGLTDLGALSAFVDPINDAIPPHNVSPSESGHHARGSEASSALTPWSAQQLVSSPRSNVFVFISSRSSAQVWSPSKSMDISYRRWLTDDATRCVDRKCWACGEATISGNRLFCSSCKAIQPIDQSIDYFLIFHIDRSFNVNLKVLEQSYKDLQKKLHPDLASSKSQREQEYSAEQSAHVIQAYYILLRPLTRARYMLELHGIKVEEEGTIDDHELLMEIMEIRESIEDASDAEELKQAQISNKKRILDCEKALEGTFRDGDFAKAVAWVQRLAYYIKVSEEVIRKM